MNVTRIPVALSISSVLVAWQRSHVNVFTPLASTVGIVVTTPSSHLWSKGSTSLFSLAPHLLQTLVSSPFSVQVGIIVMVQSLNWCSHSEDVCSSIEEASGSETSGSDAFSLAFDSG